MLKPEYVDGEKLQMICGLGPVVKKTAIQQAIKQLREGVVIEWKGEQRLLKTGEPALLLEERQEWSKKAGGRHQNLNPDSKISLNHANLNLVNLWVVVSQEFHTHFSCWV